MNDTTSRRPSLEGPGGYRLTTSFPYLVRRVGIRVGELFDRAAASYGVDVSMYRVLASLAECDGQQLGQLSEMTAIELSTLSRLVGAMAAKGLLTRRRPRANGRIVEISLSSKGRKLVLDLIPIAVHFEAIALAGFTPAEIARLKSQLETASRRLKALEQELDEHGSAASAPRRKRRPARTEAQS
jgi:DNA-binding MarR family transcriptional regulator